MPTPEGGGTRTVNHGHSSFSLAAVRYVTAFCYTPRRSLACPERGAGPGSPPSHVNGRSHDRARERHGGARGGGPAAAARGGGGRGLRVPGGDGEMLPGRDRERPGRDRERLGGHRSVLGKEELGGTSGTGRHWGHWGALGAPGETGTLRKQGLGEAGGNWEAGRGGGRGAGNPGGTGGVTGRSWGRGRLGRGSWDTGRD